MVPLEIYFVKGSFICLDSGALVMMNYLETDLLFGHGWLQEYHDLVAGRQMGSVSLSIQIMSDKLSKIISAAIGHRMRSSSSLSL